MSAHNKHYPLITDFSVRRFNSRQDSKSSVPLISLEEIYSSKVFGRLTNLYDARGLSIFDKREFYDELCGQYNDDKFSVEETSIGGDFEKHVKSLKYKSSTASTSNSSRFIKSIEKTKSQDKSKSVFNEPFFYGTLIKLKSHKNIESPVILSNESSSISRRLYKFLYFSFITLVCLGFGFSMLWSTSASNVLLVLVTILVSLAAFVKLSMYWASLAHSVGAYDGLNKLNVKDRIDTKGFNIYTLSKDGQEAQDLVTQPLIDILSGLTSISTSVSFYEDQVIIALRSSRSYLKVQESKISQSESQFLNEDIKILYKLIDYLCSFDLIVKAA